MDVSGVQETVKSEELSGVGHGITPLPEPFRVNSLRVNMAVDSATIALVDDRYGIHIEVLAITAQVPPSNSVATCCATPFLDCCSVPRASCECALVNVSDQYGSCCRSLACAISERAPC